MLIKGSITALVTPMKEDASIDYESLKNLINFQKSELTLLFQGERIIIGEKWKNICLPDIA